MEKNHDFIEMKFNITSTSKRMRSLIYKFARAQKILTRSISNSAKIILRFAVGIVKKLNLRKLVFYVFITIPMTLFTLYGTFLSIVSFEAMFLKKKHEDIIFIVYFERNQRMLSKEGWSLIDHVTSSSNSLPIKKILLSGHSDTVGSDIESLKESAQFVRIIRDALIFEGFDGDVIQEVAHGEKSPAKPTEDEKPEPLNRRVEGRIIFGVPPVKIPGFDAMLSEQSMVRCLSQKPGNATCYSDSPFVVPNDDSHSFVHCEKGGEDNEFHCFDLLEP